jgi:GNAT superfamily N-acetyltransferase
MLTITEIDTKNKAQVSRFIDLPYRLYRDHPQWVPPIRSDVELMLNKEKHPLYEHSDAAFFLAEQNGEVVGRISAIENRSYNNYHHAKKAQFYLFECIDDQHVAGELFARVFDWSRARGLTTVIGPKGFGPLDGYGLQIEGFEYRQLMNMMNYNYPYYRTLVENNGFEKEVDFVSCFVDTTKFNIPERIHRIADRVRQRGTLDVKYFKNKRELVSWAGKIGRAYNDSFINNWEYHPLTDNEIKFVLDNIMLVADHRLIKVITHNEDVVGFLFGFPDISAAMQRIKGRVFPFGIFDLLLEMKRTEWIALNGAGILPEFQGRGGNALLYSEMEKTLKDYRFKYADLTQVAETAVQMRSDLVNLGGKPYKNHRVYRREL